MSSPSASSFRASSAPANVALDIAVEGDEWRSFENIEGVAEAAIDAAVRLCEVEIPKDAEISILLCDDAFIRDLNQKWRGIDKPTNVLSFPAGDTAVLGPLLGDIVIAYGTAKREAEEENKLLSSHVAHLLVHGFLHLIGYDHSVTAEAEEMEALERTILAALGIDDPYQGAFVQIADS
jgi:probable rRNA maturation factor